jgi:DNA-binding transcriptional LysR family regulator
MKKSKMLPYNLVYLKYFSDAAKAQSISQSANINFVSQSAISQAITKIEKSLGVELITHQQNKFKLTPEGEVVFEKARQIFKSIEELEDALFVEEGQVAGKIEFACMHSFALALLPKQLERVSKLHPKLQVSFRLGHTDMIKDLIKKGAIDFGLVLDNEDLSGFQCLEVYHGQYRLYVSNKNKDIQSLPFILSEEHMEINILKTNYHKKFKKELPVLMEVSSWEVISNLAEVGLGIGFFPDYVALNKKKQLKELDIGLPAIHYKVFAIFPSSQKIHKNAKAFLEAFKP